MKTLTRLSNKAKIFCDLSGYDSDKVKDAMRDDPFFEFSRCESKTEMDFEGVDYAYPYVINNPHGSDIHYI